MKRFQKILVVLDPEDQAQPALERAATFTHLNQARLHVLVLLEDLPLELRMLVTALPPQELGVTCLLRPDLSLPKNKIKLDLS